MAKKRLTTEQFVEKARAVHGSRYEYERSVYVTNKKKVTITCLEHGDFEQRPACHLSGKGCDKCRSAGLRLTTEEFISKARVVHGDRYDYDHMVYVRTSDKVTITCPEHGDFEQKPNDHLNGRGCAKCRDDGFRLTTEEFIGKARLVHGCKYGYGRTVYTLARRKVTVTCPEHGDFEQRAYSHLNGNGCTKCRDDGLRLTTEEFTGKARLVHGCKYGYGYLSSVYADSQKKITITCPEHGDFEQRPASHLRGNGCPKCSITGFNPDKQAYLYILLDTETHSRVKIGISNVPDQRLTRLKRKTPFSIERIELFETPPTETLRIESLCHSQLTSANLTGFDGATEWFKFDGGNLEALRAFILSTGGVSVG